MWSNLLKIAAPDPSEGNSESQDDEPLSEDPSSHDEGEPQRPQSLIGGLATALMDAVVPDEYEFEDDEEDGWDDDEDLNLSNHQEEELAEKGWDETDDLELDEDANEDKDTQNPELQTQEDNVPPPIEATVDPDATVHESHEGTGVSDVSNGWDDESDDLDVSDIAEQVVLVQPPSTPQQSGEGFGDGEVDETVSFHTPVTSPPPGNKELVRSVAKTSEKLDQVLDEIEEQSQFHTPYLHKTTAFTTPTILESSMDSALQDDDTHAQVAISNIQQELKLVDLLPTTPHGAVMSSASVVALANPDDRSHDTGPLETLNEERDVFDNENELKYGPVVDHLPARLRGKRSGTDLSAVAALDEVSGWDDDEGDDIIFEDEGDGDGLQSSRNEISFSHEPLLVDQTPQVEDIAHGDASVGVIAPASLAGDELLEENTSPTKDYGPVVDVMPAVANNAPVSGSLAVEATALQEDFDQDAAMDETLCDDESRENEDGWSNEDDEAEISLETSSSQMDEMVRMAEASTPVKSTRTIVEEPTSQNHVVDHVPVLPAIEPRRAASVAVIAGMDDITREKGSIQDEDVFDDENEFEYGPVVDHLPQTPRAPIADSGSISMVVEATKDIGDDLKMDESCSEGSVTQDKDDEDDNPEWPGDKADDDAVVDHTPADEDVGLKNEDVSVDVIADEDSSDQDSANGNVVFGPVVDHLPPTPATASLRTRADSVVVQFADEDTILGQSTVGEVSTGHDDVTLTSPVPHRSENKVVDHVPPRPESRLGQGSIGVAADPSEIISEVDDMTQEGGTYLYGPMVDHTPTTPAPNVANMRSDSVIVQFADEDTILGGSIVDEGTVEEMPSIQRVPSLDEEVAALNSKDVADGTDSQVVDHVPARSESRMGGNSIGVAADPSEVLSEVDDMTAEGERAIYGPMVDQTPATPASTLLAMRSDSVVVQFAEEDTIVGASTVGDATIDDMTSPHVNVQLLERSGVPRVGEDQVVDHIPPRPESRVGDASTGVAADPSEVLSEVDNMTQEGGNFGPVVDLTPPPDLSSSHADLPSGAGSTMAFAPSAPADDLDDADETEVPDDHDSWAPEVNTPNPQSGNDVPIRMQTEEPVVDFLPPTNRNRNSREALSEATVGAQSALQADNPVENDFGPVVDLTPTVRSSQLSQASTASVVTASEIRAMEKGDAVDGVAESIDGSKSSHVVEQPTISSIPIESIATGFRSQLSVDDDEEDDDSKFGPVVDHLPAIRHSLTPSRGGSTVDALETVSEANSVDQDGEGWDDVDVDFGADSTPSVSTPLVRGGITQPVAEECPTEDDSSKVMSVRFDASVDDAFSRRGLPLESAADVKEADANEAGWDDLPDDIETIDEQSSEPCNACATDTTGLCPCIERILQTNDSSSMTATVKGPDGEDIAIDFHALLRDEIMKRKIVELERDDLQKRISTESSLETARVNKAETIKRALDATKEEQNAARMALQNTIRELKEERDELNKNLHTETSSKRSLEKQLSEQESQMTKMEKIIVDALEKAESDASTISRVEGEKSELQARLTSMENERTATLQDLKKTQNTAQSDSERLRTVIELNARLEPETRRLQQELEVLRTEKSAMEEKHSSAVSSLQKDVQVNQNKLEEAQRDLEKTRRALATCSGMKTERDSALKLLSDTKDSFNEEKQRYEQRLEEQASQLSSLESVKEVMQLDLDRTTRDFNLEKEKVAATVELKALLAKSHQEKESLQLQLAHCQDELLLAQQHAGATLVNETEMQAKKEEISALQTSNNVLRQRADAAESDATALRSQLVETEERCSHLTVQVQEVKAEKESLDESLARASHDAQSFADRARELEHSLSQGNSQFQALYQEKAECESQLTSVQQQVGELAAALQSTESQLESLKEEQNSRNNDSMSISSQLNEKIQQCNDLATEKSNLEVQLHEANLELESASKAANDISQSLLATQQDNESLRQQLHSFEEGSKRLGEMEIDRDSLLTERDQLNEENEEMLVQFGLLKRDLDASEDKVLQLEDQLRAAQGNVGNIEAQLQQRIVELEGEVKAQHTEIMTRSADHQSEQDSLQAQVETLQSKCKSMAGLKSQVALLKQELEQSSVSKANLQNLLDDKCQELTESAAFADALRNEMTEVQGEFVRQTESLENEIEKASERIHENQQLNQTLIATSRERDELATRCQTLENRLAMTENKGTDDSALQDLRDQVFSYQNEIASKEGELSSTANEKAALEARMREMVDKVEVVEATERLSQTLDELDTKTHQMDELARKCVDLEAALAEAQSQSNLAVGDSASQIEGLRHQIASLVDDLQHTRDRLSEKEQEAEQLAHELHQLETEPSRAILDNMSCVSAESGDFVALKSQLISVAMALEGSETKRAEAIERLQSERLMNAQSLRKLSESMKRFYSSVTGGDS